MASEFSTQLREEIHKFLSWRHDFAIKKITYCTGLLALGSLSFLGGSIQPSLSNVLYIVPLLALAFDLYIAAEDFRIKRAGVFLERHPELAGPLESEYEKYVQRHPNRVAPFAFSIVTVLMLVGASIILWRSSPLTYQFFLWLGIVLSAELVLVLHLVRIRAQLTEDIHIRPVSADSYTDWSRKADEAR